MWETLMEAVAAWLSDPIGAAVGVGAVIFAGLNRRTVVRRLKSISDSQESVAKVEEAREKRVLAAAEKANLELRFSRRGNMDDFIVLNRGPAVAREVTVKPRCPHGSGPLAKSEEEKMPFDLRPGQRMTFMAMFDNICQPPVTTSVTWTDDAGEHEEEYPVGR